jgi:hypothetical protein
MYGLNKELNIKLTRIAEEIEEVKVAKITGDLDKDSKAVAKTDKGQIVEDAVGLPQPVRKMRKTGRSKAGFNSDSFRKPECSGIV